MEQSIQIRNLLIDRLKGFAITLVVIGHLIQMQVNPQGFDGNILFRIIYSFHMALFFFLAGQVFTLRPIKEEVLQSIRRLLIPFVVFFFIVSCKLNLHVFILSVGSYFKNPQLGFWFLFVLASIRIFSSLILNSTFFYKSLLLLFALVLGLIAGKYFSVHLILFYSPFFLVGYLLKNYLIKNTQFIFRLKKEQKSFELLSLLIVFFIVFPYFHRNEDGLGWPLFLLQKTVLATLGVLISYQFFSIFKFGIVDRCLEIAGRHSLYIYGLHLLLLPLYEFMGFACIIPMLLVPIFADRVFSLIVSNSLSYCKRYYF